MNRTSSFFLFSMCFFDTILTPYLSFNLHTYHDPGLNLGLKLKSFLFFHYFHQLDSFASWSQPCLIRSILLDVSLFEIMRIFV
jgi:hypothetical protein